MIHYGFLVFREEAPLAFFDPGVGTYAGTSLFLEGHRQNTASFGDARHATAMLRFGRLTPAAVLGLLLPLFVVAAGFSTISGERERGTLRLLLAQGATPAQIMAGKALGVGAVAVAAALPIGLITAGFVAVGGPDQPSIARMLALAVTYAAYLAGWVLLTVWVSSRRASSRATLAQLVAIWVALCVAAPRLGASLAAALHPIPSRAQFTAQVEAAQREVRLNDLHIHEIKYENDRAQRIARQEWTRFPVFEPSLPSLRLALADRPHSLAALGLWVILPLAGLGLGRKRLPRVGVDGSGS